MAANGTQPSLLDDIPEPLESEKSPNLVSPKQFFKRAKKGVRKAAKRVLPGGRSRPSVNPLSLAATEASRNAQKQLETQQVGPFYGRTPPAPSLLL